MELEKWVREREREKSKYSLIKFTPFYECLRCLSTHVFTQLRTRHKKGKRERQVYASCCLISVEPKISQLKFLIYVAWVWKFIGDDASPWLVDSCQESQLKPSTSFKPDDMIYIRSFNLCLRIYHLRWHKKKGRSRRCDKENSFFSSKTKEGRRE